VNKGIKKGRGYYAPALSRPYAASLFRAGLTYVRPVVKYHTFSWLPAAKGS
jgi:hypothetical protein